MNLEVWFPAQDEVTVFLESAIADVDEEQFYETSLFTLFAARHIANGRGDLASSSLAEVLVSIDERQPLADLEARLEGEVRISSPTMRGGRKGFTAEFRPEKRAFFKLHMHGFGMLGKGAAYYAPTSTLALLCWLLRRRQDDETYQRALGAAANAVGIAGINGAISITSQSKIAMMAATAAWVESDDPLPEGFELSEEATRAAQRHGINFAALYEDARGRLDEAVREMEPTNGQATVVLPFDLCTRTCRVEVAGFSDLFEENSPIHIAFQAVQAAEATGNEDMISAAYAHYDNELERGLDEQGLTPLVDELEGLLFSSDPEQPGE